MVTVKYSTYINTLICTYIRLLHFLVVLVDGKVVSSIGRGICVLLGISRKDTSQEMRNGMDASQLYFNVSGSLVECRAKKLLNLRIFLDPVTENHRKKASLI